LGDVVAQIGQVKHLLHVAKAVGPISISFTGQWTFETPVATIVATALTACLQSAVPRPSRLRLAALLLSRVRLAAQTGALAWPVRTRLSRICSLLRVCVSWVLALAAALGVRLGLRIALGILV
jgi:hypothetical protein